MGSKKENKSYNDDIDYLHVQHIGFSQWGVRDKAIAEASLKDESKRGFGARFFIEDLRAGTNWAYVKIENEGSSVIGTNEDEVRIFFEKNETNGFLKSILVELQAENVIKAFKEASKYIFSSLSILSFFYRRPFNIGNIIVIDSKYLAYFEKRKFCSKEEIFIRPSGSFKNSPIGSLFAMYGDGMNSVDIAYRYICFFKIYEAWYERRDKFFTPMGQKESEKPEIIITNNLLSTAYRNIFHENFINKTFCDSSVYKKLKDIRHYLVHPIRDRGVPESFLNLDEIEHLEMLEAMSNFVERIATKILDVELKLMAETDQEIAVLLYRYSSNMKGKN